MPLRAYFLRWVPGIQIQILALHSRPFTLRAMSQAIVSSFSPGKANVFLHPDLKIVGNYDYFSCVCVCVPGRRWAHVIAQEWRSEVNSEGVDSLLPLWKSQGSSSSDQL